ncbi:MAG: hypothetical protein QOD51_3179 [Candidatus Eremiobacteraeota bacterium]|nr:hypothetical protein [Candidatus Eremiobacteraeota bacterium]
MNSHRRKDACVAERRGLRRDFPPGGWYNNGMQAPLKKLSEKARTEQANNEADAGDAVLEDSAPLRGSAYVKPPSFGGASLVKEAKVAAFKARSLLS